MTFVDASNLSIGSQPVYVRVVSCLSKLCARHTTVCSAGLVPRGCQGRRHDPASSGHVPWKHLQVAGAVQTPLDEQLLAHRGASPGSDHRACSDTRAFSLQVDVVVVHRDVHPAAAQRQQSDRLTMCLCFVDRLDIIESDSH